MRTIPIQYLTPREASQEIEFCNEYINHLDIDPEQLTPEISEFISTIAYLNALIGYVVAKQEDQAINMIALNN